MYFIKIALAVAFALIMTACASLGGKGHVDNSGSVKIANEIDGIIIVIRGNECKVPYNTEAEVIASDIKECLYATGNIPSILNPTGFPSVGNRFPKEMVDIILTKEVNELAVKVLEKIAE